MLAIGSLSVGQVTRVLIGEESQCGCSLSHDCFCMAAKFHRVHSVTSYYGNTVVWYMIVLPETYNSFSHRLVLERFHD